MKKLIREGLEPLVSIITPLFNSQDFIAQTIESVQAQTYSNWEQIIVDDCSTDSSISIVNAFAQVDKRIRLITLSRNSGAAISRNIATENARGDYIAFLDSDDMWHPQKLQKQIAFMQQANCAVSYTSYLHIDEGGTSLKKRIKALPSLSYEKQHTNNYVGNLTGMYRASEIGKISAPNIRKRQDWAMWLEAIKRSNRNALGLQEDLAYYRVRSESMSANKLNLVAYNFAFYREFLGYSWLKSVCWLLRFFWEYFIIRPQSIERVS